MIEIAYRFVRIIPDKHNSFHAFAGSVDMSSNENILAREIESWKEFEYALREDNRAIPTHENSFRQQTRIETASR